MTPAELTSWRKQRGLNQGQLADALGVSRQTIINWERSHFSIPDDLPLRLSRLVLAGKDLVQTGHITPASHPDLWSFKHNIGNFVPGKLHPWSLARRGLLAWPGCSWHNAWDVSCSEPHVDMLEQPAYQAAVECLRTDQSHPAIVAVRRHFYAQKKDQEPGVRFTEEAGDTFIHRDPSMEPWHGFYVLCERGTEAHLQNPATDARVLVKPPMPAGYWISRERHGLVARKIPGE